MLIVDQTDLNLRVDVAGPSRSLRFVTQWIIDMPRMDELRGVSESMSFTTTYKTAAFDWVANLYHRRRTPRFVMPVDGVDLYLEAGRSPMGQPKPLKVLMGYTIYADNSYKEMLYHQPPTSTSVSASVFGTSECFKAPPGRFKQKLVEFMTNPLRTMWRFVISLDIVFNQASFLDAQDTAFSKINLRPTDVSTDFRDFCLICRDGEVVASKMALYLATEFFREKFQSDVKEGVDVDRHELTEYSVATMQVLVDYVHSNTTPPGLTLDVDQVGELMQAFDLLKPNRREDFRICVHKSLINNLKQVAETNVTEVVRILVVANRSNFAHLKMMCFSAIVNMHYDEFTERYSENALNDADRIIFRQLQSTRAFTFQSPVEFMEKMRVKKSRAHLVLAS